MRRSNRLQLGTTQPTSRSQAMENQNKHEMQRTALENIADVSASDMSGDFDTALFDPREANGRDLRRAMPGVLRRAQANAASL